MYLRLALLCALVALLVRSTLVTAAGVELVVREPMQDSVVQGDRVTVYFDVIGLSITPSTVPLDEAGKRPDANKAGEGHLHFMIDLNPVVVWDKDEPYMFTNVPPGEHEIMTEVVNNDHSSLTPPVMERIRVRTEAVATTQDQQTPTTGTLPRTGASEPFAQRWSLLVLAGLLIVAGLVLSRQRWAYRSWDV